VAVLALGLAAATVVGPVVTLVVIQSSMIGVVFTLVAAMVQRLVERPRRAASAVFSESGGLATSATPGSSLSRADVVGSDDSTAIRVRAVSTVDHVAESNPSTPSGSVARGSISDRA
jgi:hypothetical protein